LATKGDSVVLNTTENLTSKNGYNSTNHKICVPLEIPRVHVQLQKRNNIFTVLRFILASIVIMQHSYYLIDGDSRNDPLNTVFGTLTSGDMAVDLFFILSGYLITASWLRRPNFKNYLKSRILRIHPGFCVAAILSMIVAAAQSKSGFMDYIDSVNLSKFIAGLPLLETLGLPKSVNASLWSVAYEFRMYLLVPVLGYFGILDHSWRVASLALLVSLYWCFGSVPSRLPGPGINFLVINPSEFLRATTMFLWGAWFYTNYEKIPRKQMVFIAAVLILPLVLYFQVGRRIFFAPLAGFLFISIGLTNSNKFSRWLDQRDFTYGLYLYGWPVQLICLNWLGPYKNVLALSLFSIVFASLIGYASWMLVESPAIRFSSRNITKESSRS
jgi:peptidoglycan/LPS O-acetylase OafA/YrhL